MRRALPIGLMILLILLAGCSPTGPLTSAQTGQATGSTAAGSTAAGFTAAGSTAAGSTAPAATAAGSAATAVAPRPLSVAYICRDLQHPWYRRIAQAMEARCREWGIEFRSEDCLNRDDLFVKHVDSYVANRPDVLIVSPTNEGIGPVVTTKCAAAKIPLLSIDARLKHPDGRDASYIGKAAYDCGVIGAREMVAQAKARGFFQGSLQVVELTISSFYHVSQLVSGFDRTLRLEAPVSLDGSTVVVETVDDSFSAQYLTLTRKLVELDPTRKYIVFTYNDDGALAFYRLALERGIDFRSILVCGVGGYEPSYQIFTRAGPRAASYFAVSISAAEIGRRAIDIVRDTSARKVALPESTTVPASVIRAADYLSHPGSTTLGTPDSLARADAFYSWKIA